MQEKCMFEKKVITKKNIVSNIMFEKKIMFIKNYKYIFK